jgi:hypothetical protein
MQTVLEWVLLIMSGLGVVAAAKQFVQRGANLGLWA